MKTKFLSKPRETDTKKSRCKGTIIIGANNIIIVNLISNFQFIDIFL